MSEEDQEQAPFLDEVDQGVVLAVEIPESNRGGTVTGLHDFPSSIFKGTG